MKDDKLSIIESLLLAVGRPLAIKELANFLSIDESDWPDIIVALQARHNQPHSGIHVAVNNRQLQLITNPDNGKMLQQYFKDELTGELTKPSVETLTIIAYRQPISKEELEQIRGVNCSLILRNLLIRGLIEANDDTDNLATTYSVTMDFLRHLGISNVVDLPDYEKLNSDTNLQKFLEANLDSDESKVEQD